MTDVTDAFYNLAAARTPEQHEQMVRAGRAGICIFCAEHIAEHLSQPIEFRGTYWFVTRNAYPYEGVSAHYLIVSQRHVRAFDELPDEAGSELWAIKRQLKTKFAARATGTVERSGDMRLNGSSIAHLHVHFVVLDEAPSKTVKFRVSARGISD